MENNIITNKELYFYYTDELGISNEDAVLLITLALAGFGKEINWKQIRDEFFNECVTDKKINIDPHDLFEWFKNKLS